VIRLIVLPQEMRCAQRSSSASNRR
jgi:hypothetical protein